VYKASEKIEPNVTTLIANHKIDLIVNIPRGLGSNHKTDGFIIRRLSIDHHIPLITNLQIAQVLLQCLAELKFDKLPLLSWREFIATKGVLCI
jgi:methylglyoxal synthase